MIARHLKKYLQSKFQETEWLNANGQVTAKCAKIDNCHTYVHAIWSVFIFDAHI